MRGRSIRHPSMASNVNRPDEVMNSDEDAANTGVKVYVISVKQYGKAEWIILSSRWWSAEYGKRQKY